MSVLPQCFRCRHLRGGAAYRCDAFPDVDIPEPILTNEHDHRKPFDGDHGVRFEAKEPAAGADLTDQNGKLL